MSLAAQLFRVTTLELHGLGVNSGLHRGPNGLNGCMQRSISAVVCLGSTLIDTAAPLTTLAALEVLGVTCSPPRTRTRTTVRRDLAPAVCLTRTRTKRRRPPPQDSFGGDGGDFGGNDFFGGGGGGWGNFSGDNDGWDQHRSWQQLALLWKLICLVSVLKSVHYCVSTVVDEVTGRTSAGSLPFNPLSRSCSSSIAALS